MIVTRRATLTSPRNYILLITYNGEAAWLCLMLCKTDSELFSESTSDHPPTGEVADSSSNFTVPLDTWQGATLRELDTNDTMLDFVCAAVIHWVTNKESVGANWRPRLDRRASRRRTHEHDDACQKVPGLCSQAFTSPFATGGTTVCGRVIELEHITPVPHPGGLVPGSLYFGNPCDTPERERDGSADSRVLDTIL